MIIGGITTAMGGVLLTAFLTRFVPSRLVFIFAWAIVIALFVMRRMVSRTLRTALWKRGIYVDRVLVIGSGESGRRIMEAMLNSPALGYHLVGFVNELPETSDLSVATEHRVHRAQRVGSIDELERLVGQHRSTKCSSPCRLTNCTSYRRSSRNAAGTPSSSRWYQIFSNFRSTASTSARLAGFR